MQAPPKPRILWRRIENRLDSWSAKDWRERIAQFGQLDAVRRRSQGCEWSDDQVFQAVLLAVLSANTAWSKIESVQSELANLFSGFSLVAYAGLSSVEIDRRFLPWFKERRAGSISLRGGLVHLIDAARILLDHSRKHGSADDYFTAVMSLCSRDPKQAALKLGTGRNNPKLPSLGVALSAEALKNLGYDVAKPDRHIQRAACAFGLVRFKGWDRVCKGRRGGPRSSSEQKLYEVMLAIEKIAVDAGQRVVLVDNAIWLLCAKDELHLTNPELVKLAT